MEKDKKNNEKQPKKIMRMLNVFGFLWSIVLFAIVIYLRFTSEIPALLIYLGMGIVYPIGFYVLQKVLERSRWSAALEEANRECEEEEERKPASKEKPEMASLIIMAVIAFIFAIGNTWNIVSTIMADYSKGLSIQKYLPQCADMLTIILCCVFIAIIIYNVSKSRVFDNRNTFCISSVGFVVLINSVLQTHEILGTNVNLDFRHQMPYMLFGMFILFFGQLFGIAVKMKKEQELTI